MLNSVDSGRRLMLRAALYPLLAVVVAAAGFYLLSGLKQALAVLLTGLATVAGGWLAARTALGGGVQAAGAAMARLILAMVFKWVLVIAALVLGFGLWRLPPLGLLAGIAIGLIFQVLALAKR
ncbi:ATP synthase subunit I [Stenotrophomonas panacihumi]|nr:ATP synthase subunit I [Stenotrophomonas panacihumi]